MSDAIVVALIVSIASCLTTIIGFFIQHHKLVLIQTVVNGHTDKLISTTERAATAEALLMVAAGKAEDLIKAAAIVASKKVSKDAHNRKNK